MIKVLRLSLNIGLTVAMVIAAFIPGVTASADDIVEATAIGEVTDPGILPDSGFYFMKSWGRNLQLMFTAGETEKARLMLQYSNEDALALKKLCDMGKCDEAAKHAGQYSLQLQNAIQTMEYVRVRQGASVSAALDTELEQNYLQQQGVLLSVLEKAPEAAQPGILNAIDNSSKHVSAVILAHQGQAALEQYQEQVKQQTSNMGEDSKIMVQQRLQIMHGQSEQTSTSTSAQGVMTPQTTQTQTQAQIQTQTQIQAPVQLQQQAGLQVQLLQQTGQQSSQHNTQNQAGGQSGGGTDNNTQGNGNSQQGK